MAIATTAIACIPNKYKPPPYKSPSYSIPSMSLLANIPTAKSPDESTLIEEISSLSLILGCEHVFYLF